MDIVQGGGKRLMQDLEKQANGEIEKFSSQAIKQYFKNQTDTAPEILESETRMKVAPYLNLMGYVTFKNGKASLTPESKAAIFEKSRKYLTDTESIKAYEAHVAAAEALNEMFEHIRYHQSIYGLNQYFSIKNDKWQIELLANY